MNEHQVAIGESTCASWLFATPTSAGGKAQIEVREMSKLALERTTSARDAIQLMGDLATELGYYSADWSGGDLSRGEGGESLQVVDTKEAWVFHVTSGEFWCTTLFSALALHTPLVYVCYPLPLFKLPRKSIVEVLLRSLHCISHLS